MTFYTKQDLKDIAKSLIICIVVIPLALAVAMVWISAHMWGVGGPIPIIG
jgi:cell division protein FtsL